MDFTAIIGPNGSGKSNLMDAISFVLGLRSVHLRGQHLKDLIFRGSDSDASGITRASVKLVMALGSENPDDSGGEIEFVRVITSAGASDYKINGRSVTWKEYDEKLKSFGILTKTRNFLVFQVLIRWALLPRLRQHRFVL